MYYPYVRQSEKRVLTVFGNASIKQIPDKAQVRLEVLTENFQLSKAQQENANIMNQVIESLLQLGIPRENIRTLVYNIQPKYDYVEGKQNFTGYEVRNILIVTIETINQIGQVIDIAVKNGVNRVAGIQFMIQEQTVAYEQALNKALENAVGKAQAMAATLQLNLDPQPIKLVEIKEDQSVHIQPFGLAKESMSTPIEPGELTVHATVEAKFQY